MRGGISARIALLTPCIPFPLDTGGKVRSFHIARGLTRLGKVLGLAFTSPRERIIGEKGAASLDLEWRTCLMRKSTVASLIFNPFISDPFLVQLYKDKRMQRIIDRALAEERCDVVFVDTIQMSSYAFSRDIPSVLDVRDMLSVYHEKARTKSRGFLRKTYHRIQATKHIRYAERRFPDFDCLTVCSARDAHALGRVLPQAHVEVLQNGVDCEYFKPSPTSPQSSRLVFVGSMDYLPNIQAVNRFVRRIFPRLAEEIPGLTLSIVGRRPAKEVLDLADANRIFVTGDVVDVRPYIAEAAVVISPIEIATGIQNKVLEAMAMAKPVVCSPESAIEGIPEGAGLFVADDDDGFCRKLELLLSDPEKAAEAGRRARETVERKFSWERFESRLETILDRFVS